MKTVVGLMDTYTEAESLVRDLVDSGFERDSISIVANKEYAGEKQSEGKQRAKGAGKGAGAGAVVGGTAGLILGLTGLAIPGIGPVIAAGPIVAALTGAGVGAAAGGIIGALTKMGVPEEHAQYYSEGVRRGGTLVTLTTDDASADRAADIMSRHGAVDIDKRSEQWKKTGWSRFDEKAAPYTAEQRQREAVLPVVEEEVRVGKREVAKGGVRVHSYVTERPVEEKVTLREEHAKVERRPADRPLKAGEEAFRETSFEIEERAEEPVVQKEARVKEEVVVGKEASERTETIRETARRTDVDVDEDADFRSHFKTNYASLGDAYESYSPAYRYAGTLSRDKRYTNKEWPQIENDVRTDWEKQNPGTWDKFKGAIRYGWDRMRGRAGRKAA
jgi:stress response protein YsnF